MAFLKSKVPFTLKSLNWNQLNDADVELENNVNARFQGNTYEDVLVVREIDDPDSGADIGGTRFSLNGDTPRPKGTVEGLRAFLDGRDSFFVVDVEIPVSNILIAVETSGFNDDKQIWKKAFKGDDKMVLSNGTDNMQGFGGDDLMKGRGGNDTLKGNGGADNLQGGNGDDKLIGGGGDDRMDGGAGNDLLKGGKGVDTFLFKKVVGGDSDTVRDFKLGTDILQIKGKMTPVSGDTNDDGDAVLSFKGGDVTFAGVSNVDALLDAIEFV